MLEKIKNWMLKMNQEGFPLPMLRDPKTGKGSVTLTMFWISFNVALLTLAGKFTKVLGDVDYSNVLWLFGLTGGMYLGRKFQSSKEGVSVDSPVQGGEDA
jgi:hypothetical protein